MKTMSPHFQFLAAIVSALLTSPSSLPAAETGRLDEPLEPLRPFMGRTWRGEFKNSTPEKPTIDVARWERALNGRAVRVLHSINDGYYGGESLIRWDKEKNQITYHYFSTAGFYNAGVMTVAGNTLTAVEKVFGNTNGVTEVRSTYELRTDGTLLNRSQYMKDGQPTGSREVLYKEDPKAEVKFK
jgi:hypothetical protein